MGGDGKQQSWLQEITGGQGNERCGQIYGEI